MIVDAPGLNLLALFFMVGTRPASAKEVEVLSFQAP